MLIRFRKATLWMMFALCAFLQACGGSGEGPGSPLPYFPPPAPTGISILDPDPSSILEADFTHPDGTPYRRAVPVNQVLVMFEETVTQAMAGVILSNMQADLARVGLALVGQIPQLGIYQLRVDNPHADPADAIAFLDAVLADLSAYAGVDTASYNELLEERFAENDDDNCRVIGYDRAAFAVLDYFQAIPVFEAILPHLTLHPVKVAVIDSGIELETGQFDTIQSFPGGFEYLDVGYPENGPTDIHPQRHGTAVAGIIAADNGDGIVNGIALRVLGSRLSLFVGNVHIAGNIYHLGRTLAGCQIAVERGARIVNLSSGMHFEGRRPPVLERVQNLYKRLFSAPGSANVLFVAAASNDRLVIDNNDAPGGIPVSNLITVGGISSTVFDARYSESATGPGIDIAAPATNVPVCCFGNAMIGYHRRHLDGNSYAAPFVSSIAAIILSVDPTLTGAELKDFLTDPANTLPAPAEVGGIRPALLRTVGNAILQRGASSPAVETVIDNFFGLSDNTADPSGHAINRLLGEIDFTVSGPGHSRHHELGPEDLSYGVGGHNFGIIQPVGTVLNFRSGGEVVSVAVDGRFELGRTYTFPAEGGFLLTTGAPRGPYTGFGEGGSVTFTECELTVRSLPLDFFDRGLGLDRFVFIQVAGQLVGGVARGTVESVPPEEDVLYNVSASFTKAFLLLGVDGPDMNHLEEVCQGGYRYTPPGS